jgi:membrane protease YdiL (CAAX protease family)
VLVVGVAFGAATIGSLYAFFTSFTERAPPLGGWAAATSVWNELFAIGLLTYVLGRQGRRFAQLGLRPTWTDLPRSFMLVAVAVLVIAAALAVGATAYRTLTGRSVPPSRDLIPFARAGIGVSTVILIALSALFEELIGRAYVISEIVAMTDSRAAAIAVSVLVQAVYHLYQGLPQALAAGAVFLVFSLYYVRTGLLFPIILAHLYLDALGMFAYARL